MAGGRRVDGGVLGPSICVERTTECTVQPRLLSNWCARSSTSGWLDVTKPTQGSLQRAVIGQSCARFSVP